MESTKIKLPVTRNGPRNAQSDTSFSSRFSDFLRSVGLKGTLIQTYACIGISEELTRFCLKYSVYRDRCDSACNVGLTKTKETRGRERRRRRRREEEEEEEEQTSSRKKARRRKGRGGDQNEGARGGRERERARERNKKKKKKKRRTEEFGSLQVIEHSADRRASNAAKTTRRCNRCLAAVAGGRVGAGESSGSRDGVGRGTCVGGTLKKEPKKKQADGGPWRWLKCGVCVGGIKNQ